MYKDKPKGGCTFVMQLFEELVRDFTPFGKKSN